MSNIICGNENYKKPSDLLNINIHDTNTNTNYSNYGDESC